MLAISEVPVTLAAAAQPSSPSPVDFSEWSQAPPHSEEAV